MSKEAEEFILEQAKRNITITTWWMSDFYEDFCKNMGYNFNDLTGNARKIRYHCNKLVNKGKLKKRRMGTEYGGKSLYGFNHSTDWYIE